MMNFGFRVAADRQALPPDAFTYHDTFDAKYVTKYLEDCIDNHVYDGMSLRSRIFFGHRIQRVHKAKGT